MTLGIVDYWSILVRFVPLLSRTNSCIWFAPYLESAGRTASATLVLDCAHSSSIKSVLLKTQLRWVGHVIGVEEHLHAMRSDIIMVSWLLAKDTWVIQRNATKTLLRAIFIGAISSQRISNLVLEIVCFGQLEFIKLPPPLKTPAANDLLQSVCHATRLHLQ